MAKKNYENEENVEENVEVTTQENMTCIDAILLSLALSGLCLPFWDIYSGTNHAHVSCLVGFSNINSSHVANFIPHSTLVEN